MLIQNKKLEILLTHVLKKILWTRCYIPATILKRCKELSTFNNIINKSLETGCMPAQLKEAMLKPKLKKNNFSSKKIPISDRSQISKKIEKAVATQLMGHLINNSLHWRNLFNPHTNACHGTETAS